jgi:predicted permease
MSHNNQLMIEQQQNASIIILLIGWVSPFIAFAITAAVMIALFPPKNRTHVFGLLSCCAASFFYGGAFVIDYFGYQHYSEDARLGIRFFCAVPMWMCLQILAVVLTAWRDARDPISKIARDIKKIKRIKDEK